MALRYITLSTENNYGKRIPPQHCGIVLQLIVPSIQKATKMAFEGISTGGNKKWLQSCTDIFFTGHEGEKDTVLCFDVPTLGESVQELYQQQEFWSTKPDEKDTCFEIFGKALSDIACQNRDSILYDSHLLQEIAKFKKVIGKPFHSLIIEKDMFPVLDTALLRVVDNIDKNIPAPKNVSIVGKLDMVRCSTQSFALKLDAGEEIRGVFMGESTDVLKSFLGQRVFIQGKIIYRPSGKILRLESEYIEPGEDAPAIFSEMPTPDILSAQKHVKPQTRQTGVNAFFAQWPGNETDEEWNKIIERLS